MASPIGTSNNQGNGVQQIKAQVVGWIKDEIRDSNRSGLGIAPGQLYAASTNFALSLTETYVATQVVTVPLGMSQAVVQVVSRVYVANPNSAGGADTLGGDYFYSRAFIAGAGGDGLPMFVKGSGSVGIGVAPLSLVLTGLVGGGTFTVGVTAWANLLTWAAGVNNTAELSGSIVWLR
jgi:hypothetical protein